jgi:hypothetical protein
MDNSNLEETLDYFSLQLLESTKLTVLMTHFALSSALGKGVFMTVEVPSRPSNFLVIGIRPNSTAYIATCSEEKIFWNFVTYNSDSAEIFSRLNILECDDNSILDSKWSVMEKQINEWCRCEREIIDIIGNDKNCA